MHELNYAVYTLSHSGAGVGLMERYAYEIAMAYAAELFEEEEEDGALQPCNGHAIKHD